VEKWLVSGSSETLKWAAAEMDDDDLAAPLHAPNHPINDLKIMLSLDSSKSVAA
jgi:hypothetical protein